MKRPMIVVVATLILAALAVLSLVIPALALGSTPIPNIPGLGYKPIVGFPETVRCQQSTEWPMFVCRPVADTGKEVQYLYCMPVIQVAKGETGLKMIPWACTTDREEFLATVERIDRAREELLQKPEQLNPPHLLPGDTEGRKYRL